jgi:hypothetical protein
MLAVLATAVNIRKFSGVLLMFSAPLAITFCLSLTPDVTVNHKYLMISAALLNILAAYAITGLYDFQIKKPRPVPWIGWVCKGLACLLAAVMLSTGIFDNIALANGNGRNKSFQAPLESSFHTWLLEHTEPGDVFISAWHTIHPIFLAGRFEYLGWPYYAWSAGYDTNERSWIMQALFASEDPQEFLQIMRETGASYILVDRDLLAQPEFTINEAVIQAACALVYTDENDGFRVYQAKLYD